MATTKGIRQHQSTWSPSDNNGGTCIAIAGANYCVIAADTRMSTGYSILTRDYSKICNLADKCVMASLGFQADVKALQKNLSARHLISGAKVKLHDSQSGGSDRVIEISGTLEQTHATKSLLQAFIATGGQSQPTRGAAWGY